MWERQFERIPSIPRLLFGLNVNVARIGMMLASMDGGEDAPDWKELARTWNWWDLEPKLTQPSDVDDEAENRERWGKHYDKMARGE